MRPSSSCTLVNSRCALDKRRWDGRTAVSYVYVFDKARAAYSRFEQVHQYLAMHLTISPTEIDVLRVTTAVYQTPALKSHAYDIIRNPGHVIGK